MSIWLTEGPHKKLGITILPKHPTEDAGTFAGGGLKTLWHTTEGGTLESVVQTLIEKRAEVHFVLDIQRGRAIQLISLDESGRGLEHTLAAETNRANVIQTEIVGFAAESGKWSRISYGYIAALTVLIERHHKTPRTYRSFSAPVKFIGDGFYDFAGHCGHVHVPGNSHTDPGVGFEIDTVLQLMKGKR